VALGQVLLLVLLFPLPIIIPLVPHTYVSWGACTRGPSEVAAQRNSSSPLSYDREKRNTCKVLVRNRSTENLSRISEWRKKLGTWRTEERTRYKNSCYCAPRTLLQSRRIASFGMRGFCPEDGSNRFIWSPNCTADRKKKELLSTKFVLHFSLQLLSDTFFAPRII
jgi:hypothetical protein